MVATTDTPINFLSKLPLLTKGSWGYSNYFFVRSEKTGFQTHNLKIELFTYIHFIIVIISSHLQQHMRNKPKQPTRDIHSFADGRENLSHASSSEIFSHGVIRQFLRRTGSRDALSSSNDDVQQSDDHIYANGEFLRPYIATGDDVQQRYLAQMVSQNAKSSFHFIFNTIYQ